MPKLQLGKEVCLYLLLLAENGSHRIIQETITRSLQGSLTSTRIYLSVLCLTAVRRG